jgi:hypothetical protein
MSGHIGPLRLGSLSDLFLPKPSPGGHFGKRQTTHREGRVGQVKGSSSPLLRARGAEALLLRLFSTAVVA